MNGRAILVLGSAIAVCLLVFLMNPEGNRNAAIEPPILASALQPSSSNEVEGLGIPPEGDTSRLRSASSQDEHVELSFSAEDSSGVGIAAVEWKILMPTTINGAMETEGVLSFRSRLGEAVYVEGRAVDRAGDLLIGSTMFSPTESENRVVVLESIRGRVFGRVMSPTGPAAGVRVNLSDGHVVFARKTDRSGEFEFAALQPGRFHIQIGQALSPFHEEEFVLERSAGREFAVVIPGQSVSVTLRSEGGASIPSGLDIFLHQTDQWGVPRKSGYGIIARTDGSDTVVFEGVAPGEVFIESGFTKLSAQKLERHGLAPASIHAMVEESQTDVSLLFGEFAGCKVVVYSEKEKNPVLVPIWIETSEGLPLTPPGNEYTSSSRGDRVVPCTPGWVRVCAGGWPYGYGYKEVQVSPGEIRDVQIDLSSPGIELTASICSEFADSVEVIYLIDDEGRIASKRTPRPLGKPTLNFAGDETSAVLSIGKDDSVKGADVEREFLVPKPGQYSFWGRGKYGWIPASTISIDASARVVVCPK